MHSPIVPPDFQVLSPAAEIADTGSSPFVFVHADPYTTAQYAVVWPGDEPLLHVAITGPGRLGPKENYTNLVDRWFCTSANGCECPKDTTGTPPATVPLNEHALGLSGDPASGTQGELYSKPLSDFCTPKTQTPGHTGNSNGDPYIATFDGGHYGFQTAGEFTLVKSTVDGLEIQARQVPYGKVLGGGFADSLAMNSTFAMRDGGAIVEVDKGSPLVVFIDRHRRRARPGQVIALPGGGTVRYTPTQVDVRWADGTRATFLSIGSEGVNIFVTPSSSRAGRLTGLLGNDNGSSADDYVGRDGRRYSAKVIQSAGLFVWTEAERKVMLSGFGASWRITQPQSLFVYPPGRSTSSYVVPGFPRVLVSLAALSVGRRQAAARTCERAGISNRSLLIGCEIDYGATGDRRLTAAVRALQLAARIPRSTGGLSGSWSGQYSGTFHGRFSLRWAQRGSKLIGVIAISGVGGRVPINGTVSGSTIRFGSVGSAAVTYSGQAFGDSMAGTYRTRAGGGSWSAYRVS